MRTILPGEAASLLHGRLGEERAYHIGTTCVSGWALASIVPRDDFKDSGTNLISWLDEHAYTCGRDCEEECNNEFLLVWTRF